MKTTDHKGLHAIPCDAARLWCGPTAIAALTGLSGEAVEDAILEHRKKHRPPRGNRGLHGARVKTTWSTEIIPVFHALGFAVWEHSNVHGTLAQYLRRNPARMPRLVLITGHYIAVCGDYYVDSDKREPTPIKGSPYQRRRVRRVWSAEPK